MIVSIEQKNVSPISKFLHYIPAWIVASLLLSLVVMLTTGPLYAQNSSYDSLFIQTEREAQLISKNKTEKVEPFSFKAVAIQKGRELQLGVNGRLTALSDKGSQFIFVTNDSKVVAFAYAIEDALIQKVAKPEFDAYVSMSGKNSKIAILEFIERYPESPLTIYAKRALESRIFNEKKRALLAEMDVKNYSRATDIIMSLPVDATEGAPLRSVRKTLAEYNLAEARKAQTSGRNETALELAKISYAIDQSVESRQMVDELERSMINAQYNEQISKAKELEKSGERKKALELYGSANTLKKSDALQSKIEDLQTSIEDSTFNFAKKNDTDRTLIYYRIRNYENYLSTYRNGRYADESRTRIKKLSKISGQLTRYFVTGSLIFWNDNTSGYQIRVGRFSEKNLFSIGTSFNKDVLQVRSSTYELDKDTPILDNELYLAKVPGYDYSKPMYTTRGHVFLSYSRLIGKPRVFQYYISADLGIAYRYTYYPTYALEGDMLSLEPEKQPKLRPYSNGDGTVGTMLGLNFIFNYKVLTAEIGTRFDTYGVGYNVGAGFSF